MNDTIKLSLGIKNSDERIILDSCERFIFSKDRYIPFSNLDVTFLSEDKITDIIDVEFSINEQLVHKGLLDRCEFRINNSKKTISLKSRGYTCSLLNNDVISGFYYNATPQKMLAQAPLLVNIDVEQQPMNDCFVYLDNRANIWTAMSYLGLYTFNNLPFVSYTNTIRFTPKNSKLIYPLPCQIVSYSGGNDYMKMVSHIHMKDTDGSYGSYSYGSNEAIERNIIRHRYIPLDNQWLQNPQGALTSRINQSMRDLGYEQLTYLGFNGEDLSDRFTIDIPSVLKENIDISAIQVTGKNGIIQTKLTYYDNLYNN